MVKNIELGARGVEGQNEAFQTLAPFFSRSLICHGKSFVTAATGHVTRERQ